MALATQCPHCNTTFRVANDQLKLHGGLVRCGSCQQTFNGIEHLLAPTATAASRPSSTATPSPSTVPFEEAPASVATSTALAEPQATPEETSAGEPVHTAHDNATEISAAENHIDSAEPTVAVIPDAGIAHEISADDLDFDMGIDEPAMDSSALTPSTTPLDDEQINKVELETRIALMDDPSWSAAEADTSSADAISAHESDSANWPEPHLDDAGNSLDNDAAAVAHEPVQDANSDDAIYSGEPEQHLHDGLEFDASGKSDSITDDLSQPEHQAELPGFIIAAEKNKGRSRWIRVAMIVFSLLMLCTLLGQISYSARNQIAAWLPQTKPALSDACKLLKCQISLPAQIDQLSIESNELQALSTARSVFSLAVQLQNKGSLTQEWPMLELVLNDAKDKPVLRKVFTPADYLNNKTDLPKGFPASSEQTVKLYFELSDLKAAGYHVSIFYP
ncbi:zinc-ribbon domain-containing protein [Undibacterium sp. Jales W-56]|uniref:DUF3426 domain-containing protein n=1 Tax=Undibacterium sp. Jales W-56 TaxID=2897325 RepID=UPI0021D0A74F|nr:DUF3426 domain-containing protein [Undibacterium sp. Jales W-56]MCU6434732.1 zinc-ribbon domain-containing protein [Undibacterium sp. Jales W-56]